MAATTLAENLSGQPFGRYRLLKPITEGSMATVYGARQEAIERQVAIKVLPPQFAGDPQFVRRFRIDRQSHALLSDFGLAKPIIPHWLYWLRAAVRWLLKAK